MQVPMEIEFMMKTHPVYKLDFDSDDVHDDHAVTEEVKEQVMKPIEVQYIAKNIELPLIDTLQFAEMVDNCIVLFPVAKFNLVRKNTSRKELRKCSFFALVTQDVYVLPPDGPRIEIGVPL